MHTYFGLIFLLIPLFSYSSLSFENKASCELWPDWEIISLRIHSVTPSILRGNFPHNIEPELPYSKQIGQLQNMLYERWWEGDWVGTLVRSWIFVDQNASYIPKPSKRNSSNRRCRQEKQITQYLTLSNIHWLLLDDAISVSVLFGLHALCILFIYCHNDGAKDGLCLWKFGMLTPNPTPPNSLPPVLAMFGSCFSR